MAGRIGNDELALVGREVPVGNIDRNALLSFSTQAIGKQRKINSTYVAPDRCLRNRFQLIFVNAPRIVQQTSDQSRLAIVYAPCRRKAEQIFRLFTLEER